MSLFERVLIANRGEIAVRIIRACRELQISPVAVYTRGEESSLHVSLADDAYLLPDDGPIPYLDQQHIREIARRSNAPAIHPGYGFLSENADFAAACQHDNLVFIGPSPDAIRSMGDKVEARNIAIAAGVPVSPGSDGAVASIKDARFWAAKNGYPIAIKASAGGGGRGFRVAHSDADLEAAYTGSQGEGERYFGDGTVYLERYLENPRHVEIQIFCDRHGNAVWLGERDCSIQRRHQKLIEETPSPAVDDRLRQKLGEASLALAYAVGYENAGTVEFMVTPDKHFFFLEMNTRIQVEHTITEEVTGFDLVKEQIRVAAGKPLSFTQHDVQPRGSALQCRINAEDAGLDFKPVPGVVTAFRPPEGPGVRVDTAIEPGSAILPRYDSMIAKLITWGRDRREAVERMSRSLGEFVIEGVPTTVPFHQNVMDHEAFAKGDATTAFLTTYPDVIPQPSELGAPSQEHAPSSPTAKVQIEVNGRRFAVTLPADFVTRQNVPRAPEKEPLRLSDRPGLRSNTAASGNEIRSPIQGTVVRVGTEAGARLEPGSLICVVEAMKMENEISAHRAGTVSAIHVKAGDSVQVGALLAEVDGDIDPAS